MTDISRPNHIVSIISKTGWTVETGEYELWRAVCACGWRAAPHKRRQLSEADATQHYEATGSS